MTETKFNSRFAVVLAALTGLVVLSLAWPRLAASYRFLPVDIAIERYYESREIPSRRMPVLIGFATEAIGRHDHYRYHDGLSLLYFLRGMDIHTPALERRAAYRSAETEAMEAVKRAPTQPEAWMRMAMVRMVLRDEPEDVLEPWKMSIFTGRTHSTLLVPRTAIGLNYLEVLDRESRSMLRDQMMLAWVLKSGDLLQVLKTSDSSLEKSRSLLGNTDPAALMEMEERIEKIR